MNPTLAAPAGTTNPNTGEKALTSSRSWHRRLKRWCLVLTILAVVGWVSSPLTLGMIPYFLIAPTAPVDADLLAVVDGFEAYDVAAKLIRTGRSQKVVIWDSPPGRLGKRQLLPSPIDCMRASCERAQIDATRIDELPDEVRGMRGLLQSLRQRLKADPDVSVAILCNQWSSCWLYDKVRGTLPSDLLSRVQVVGLDDPYTPRERWWHSRHGQRRVVSELLKRAIDYLVRDSDGFPSERTDAELRKAAVG